MRASTVTSKCGSLRSAVKATSMRGSESGSGKPNCAQLEKQRRACSEIAGDVDVLRYWCSNGTTRQQKFTFNEGKQKTRQQQS